MKIEKVNENQIRCTLTREDLAVRNLKISELAYGTEKAKTLFREMMQQANYEFGFEAEDIPLMIEAIPLNAECLVLLITKVEDPEELDTRFSKFAPISHDEEEDLEEDAPKEVRDLFRRITGGRESADPNTSPSDSPDSRQFMRIFRISAMNRVIDVCKLIVLSYRGDSSLYRDKKQGDYLLLLDGSTQYVPEELQKEFDRICSTVSEYGTLIPGDLPTQILPTAAYETLIGAGAVEALGTI
ncbi:MAG: adaptor protein MecA [Acetatifactor sp.]|nr:adaptor protein MecA [Acetatifactor sp.]